MKAKLIKNLVGEYHLIVDKCPDFISISEPITNGFVIASVHNDDIDFLKLSLKNCQAIERGYDLDELATEFAEKRLGRKISKWDNVDSHSAEYACFYHGFQKRDEILGDRKFTEEDIFNAIGIALGYWSPTYATFEEKWKESVIQSLQQTEWDVEIEMEPVFDIEYPNNGYRTEKFNKTEYRPKLDADGCLILKRV